MNWPSFNVHFNTCGGCFDFYKLPSHIWYPKWWGHVVRTVLYLVLLQLRKCRVLGSMPLPRSLLASSKRAKIHLWTWSPVLLSWFIYVIWFSSILFCMLICKLVKACQLIWEKNMWHKLTSSVTDVALMGKILLWDLDKDIGCTV